MIHKFKAYDYQNLVGVYVLMRHGEIVYVGISTDLHLRIANHRRNKTLVFDTVKIYRCSLEKARKIEVYMIKYLKPLYNKSHNEDYLTRKRSAG